MGILFVTLCCGLALLFAALAIMMGVRAGRTREWVPVEGRILGNGIAIVLEQGESERGDIERYDRRFHPWVVYDYVADGATRRGTLVALDTVNAGGSDTFALRVVERYPVDRVVTVHHDPAHPERAVLEPGASRATVATICVLVSMAALFATIAVLVAADPPAVPPADLHTPN